MQILVQHCATLVSTNVEPSDGSDMLPDDEIEVPVRFADVLSVLQQHDDVSTPPIRDPTPAPVGPQRPQRKRRKIPVPVVAGCALALNLAGIVMLSGVTR
jgi:hypothetical protein